MKISRDKRKYKCPFCDHRDLRHLLVTHVCEEHEDMIPEDETAAKVVFDHLNKGRIATCITCKKHTKWNEENWRYDRTCCKECSEKFTAKMNAGKQKVYGTSNIAALPEFQKKMLEGRKISGKYKFADGGEHTYVGTYEKERLEFMDTVMGVKSWELMCPGPTIEYIFKGEKHFWITDCYYIPFNLVMDDKPGGSNPNTHPGMEELREKQLSKEDSIAKLGKFNYIRLTDKDFGQLLGAIAEVKYQMTMVEEDVRRPVVIIGENATESHKIEYPLQLVAYSIDGIKIEGYGIVKEQDMNGTLITTSNRTVDRVNKDFFDNKYYTLLSYNGDKHNMEHVVESMEEYYTTQIVIRPSCILEMVSGNKNFDEASLLYNSEFTVNYISEAGDSSTILDRISCLQEFNNNDSIEMLGFPIEEQFDNEKFLLKEFTNLVIEEDYNGVYMKNVDTGFRSFSYNSINEVQREELLIVSRL